MKVKWRVICNVTPMLSVCRISWLAQFLNSFEYLQISVGPLWQQCKISGSSSNRLRSSKKVYYFYHSEKEPRNCFSCAGPKKPQRFSTMSAIFCCSSISPYRPRQLDHEAKFRIFMRWASLQTTSLVPVDGSLVGRAPYAIQIVRQINYGPQESIRYFVPASNGSDFAEATEDDLLKSNFDKLNSYLIMKSPWVTDPVLTVKPCRYKNFRCEKHNKFFEINLYQKNPANKHHWRVNLARPSRDIDLAFRRKDPEAESGNKAEESAGQEERQELLSSDIQGKSSFPELRISLSQTLEVRNITDPGKSF